MTTWSNDSSKIEYEYREFESNCFRNSSFEITDFSGEDFQSAFNEMSSEIGLKSGDFAWIRIPLSDIESIACVTKAGFYLVETTIIPFAVLRTWREELYRRFIQPLEPVTKDSLSDVEFIAKHTFEGLRFNIDKRFGNELADERYLKWFQNAYEAGEDIRVLRHKGDVVGFSLLRHQDDGVTIFRLAGVHPDAKSLGIGLVLYASTTAHCKDLGMKRVDGGISAANIPVMNTMAAVGYSFKEPTVVLHYYFE